MIGSDDPGIMRGSLTGEDPPACMRARCSGRTALRQLHAMWLLPPATAHAAPAAHTLHRVRPGEYLKMFSDYNLTYGEAKQAALNSIRYSFIKARASACAAAAAAAAGSQPRVVAAG